MQIFNGQIFNGQIFNGQILNGQILNRLLLMTILFAGNITGTIVMAEVMAEGPAVSSSSTSADPSSTSTYAYHPLKLDATGQKTVHLVVTDEKTAIAMRSAEEERIEGNPYSLLLYKPSYILPFYYSFTPDSNVYQNSTPNNQPLMQKEFKGQLSIKVPVIKHIFSPKNAVYVAYTQLSYWQVYSASQYFRETDYEPEFFFQREENDSLYWKIGVMHQSNGRGGEYERSWNRVYGELTFSGAQWSMSVEPWLMIFQNESSDLHNPDIRQYLGDGQLVFSLKLDDNNVSVRFQNQMESNFSRGTTELDWSFPLHGHFRGYVQLFSGYGQSLIEYNHYTNAVGIGIAFNDWL